MPNARRDGIGPRLLIGNCPKGETNNVHGTYLKDGGLVVACKQCSQCQEKIGTSLLGVKVALRLGTTGAGRVNLVMC